MHRHPVAAGCEYSMPTCATTTAKRRAARRAGTSAPVVRGSSRPLGRAACRSARTCEGTASTSPSSAGTRPASASTSSTMPRTPRRPAASSSTRRGTRPATSGTSGSKGFGPGSSTAFASPDRTRRTKGIASTRTSWWWIRTPRRSCPPPDRDSRLAVGYDPSSPQKDLSFSEVDDAATAPKCVVTHEDFDWQGDQPLRLPVDVDRHLRAARARLHHPSERRRPVPGDLSRPDREDPVPEGPRRHRGRADAGAGVQRARFVAGQPDRPASASRTSGDTIRSASSRPRRRTPASARTARRSWNSRRWSARSIARGSK